MFPPAPTLRTFPRWRCCERASEDSWAAQPLYHPLSFYAQRPCQFFSAVYFVVTGALLFPTVCNTKYVLHAALYLSSWSGSASSFLPC